MKKSKEKRASIRNQTQDLQIARLVALDSIPMEEHFSFDLFKNYFWSVFLCLNLSLSRGIPRFWTVHDWADWNCINVGTAHYRDYRDEFKIILSSFLVLWSAILQTSACLSKIRKRHGNCKTNDCAINPINSCMVIYSNAKNVSPHLHGYFGLSMLLALTLKVWPINC